MAMRIAVAFALLASLGPGPRAASSPISTRPMARANDFQRTAGVVRNGVLTVKLVAQRAQWRPASDTGVALPADAFGEEGAAPSVPGPLLRATVGTRVQATIRNALPETLVVSGLRERGPGSKESPISVPPNETRPVSFTINVPGAHVYVGQLRAGGEPMDGGHGTQLFGVIIGDTTDAPPPERVLVVSFWNRLIDSTAKTSDERILFLFNGKIWPHTPRFTYTLGDTVRWRVIDGSDGEHPIHLHGFYFRVDSRGSADLDSIYTPAQRRWVVTENLQAFGNFTLLGADARRELAPPLSQASAHVVLAALHARRRGPAAGTAAHASRCPARHRRDERSRGRCDGVAAWGRRRTTARGEGGAAGARVRAGTSWLLR